MLNAIHYQLILIVLCADRMSLAEINYDINYKNNTWSNRTQVSIYTADWSISPKITFLSHHLIGSQIDVHTGDRIHLRCTGQNAIVWTFPNNNPVCIKLND